MSILERNKQSLILADARNKQSLILADVRNKHSLILADARNKQSLLSRKLESKKTPFIFWIILVGALSWSLTMVKSGLIYPFGMGFWGPNGHDGVWHVALINHIARGSFEMPVFAGESIKNYHIGFDLVLALIHKITRIPAHTLYFQIVPPILAILIGWLTYKFVLQWKKSKIQAWWATFFVYFAGDFGWILTLFRDGEIGGESLFWAQQAVSTLINPPFALSLVLLLSGLIFLLKLREKFSIFNFQFSILLFGILAPIKVYGGILTLGGLGMVALWKILEDKKLINPFSVIFVGSVVLSALLLLPTTSQARGLIVFQPFWFLETMMAVSDRVGWDRFYEAMMNYKTGNIWIKLIPAYIVAFIIFFVGNMGMRLVGVWGILKQKLWKNFQDVDVFLLTVAFLGMFLPMVILQSGTPWNTIQFFYYSLFVVALFTGIYLGKWLEEKKVKRWILIAIVLVTLPTTVSTLMRHYLPGRPPAKISKEELEALRFLERQPNGAVLTYPFDRYKASLAVSNPPRPLYLYESTAYVAAFSGKPVYLEDEVNLDITGFDWRERRKKAEMLFETLDESGARSFLVQNNINYLYLTINQSPIPGQLFRLGEAQLGIEQIFENTEVKIYLISKL